jgi:hypothetical protein
LLTLPLRRAGQTGELGDLEAVVVEPDDQPSISGLSNGCGATPGRVGRRARAVKRSMFGPAATMTLLRGIGVVVAAYVSDTAPAPVGRSAWSSLT